MAAENNGKIGSVLVVGAGIGGMQASLDLVESGFKVYLVDKAGGIGGTMSQLDKTFPTNDCAMCIMSPKVVAVGRDPNIEIMANAELVALDGVAGDFQGARSGAIRGGSIRTSARAAALSAGLSRGALQRIQPGHSRTSKAIFPQLRPGRSDYAQIDRRQAPCSSPARCSWTFGSRSG